MLSEETELRKQHTPKIGGAQIKFGGQTYNLAGLGPFHKHQNRDELR